MAVAALVVSLHAPDVRADKHVEWCQTQVKWSAKARTTARVDGTCPTQGTCDLPTVRDASIPDASTPIVTVCIKFNVFADNDGTNPAASQADVDAQLVQLNADFLPSGVEFVASTEFINDTTFRNLADSEIFAMKSAYADNPTEQLNVYVVNIEAMFIGLGTFAWDPDATTAQGGILVDDTFFGAGQKTLTHEVGHNLGLWHTHHGVSEVALCSACYERADGADGDTTGDFASDTAPTPSSFACAPPPGSDSCSGGISWGPTDPQNYMSLAADSCYTEFSPQQFGRMHCWMDAELTGWFCGVRGGCCVGEACSIQTPEECAALMGVYLGDGSDCEGTPTVYSDTFTEPIPDGGGPGNPATRTITVPDSLTMEDVNVSLDVTHTWIGDLIVTLAHGGTTVTIVDRPGIPPPGFGCNSNDLDIILDDEGTGGAVETLCGPSDNSLTPTSPPNYTPNQALSAFDGMDAAGTWTIAVSDNAGGDSGTLNAWSIRLT
ncbi:MAG: proprotein convertase P-domain-containing protein, partial [Planctomycetes bacterium]|nr:proprotein convertase P-domain-containing protein [Planctomycetota bacterium]